jgi:hypothetical protein
MYLLNELPNWIRLNIADARITGIESPVKRAYNHNTKITITSLIVLP